MLYSSRIIRSLRLSIQAMIQVVDVAEILRCEARLDPVKVGLDVSLSRFGGELSTEYSASLRRNVNVKYIYSKCQKSCMSKRTSVHF